MTGEKIIKIIIAAIITAMLKKTVNDISCTYDGEEELTNTVTILIK